MDKKLKKMFMDQRTWVKSNPNASPGQRIKYAFSNMEKHTGIKVSPGTLTSLFIPVPAKYVDRVDAYAGKKKKRY